MLRTAARKGQPAAGVFSVRVSLRCPWTRSATLQHRNRTPHRAFPRWLILGMAAPTMKERQVCWGARDLYWRCLDDNAEDVARCQQLRSSFEASCPQQWIKYFDKRRDYLKFKEKFEAGEFQPSQSTENS